MKLVFQVPSTLPSSKSSTDPSKASDKVNSSFKNKKKVPEYKLRSKDIKCKYISSKQRPHMRALLTY